MMLHRSKATESGDWTPVATDFADVLLSAFWWWGVYVESAFCRRIVEVWRAAVPAGGQADRQCSALSLLIDTYPLESDPEREGRKSRWRKVRAALQGFECPAGGEAAHYRIRGISQQLLADAYGHLGEREMAEAAYSASEEALHTGEQVLNLAYTRKYWADFRLRSCDLKGAREKCAEALSAHGVLRTPDWELVSEYCRVQSEICQAAGDSETAGGFLARWLLASYVFQGYPPPPDDYTRQYLEDTLSALHEQLVETGADDGLTLAFRRAWGPVAETAARLRNPCFRPDAELGVAVPVGPGEEELEAHGTPYLEHLISLYRATSIGMFGAILPKHIPGGRRVAP